MKRPYATVSLLLLAVLHVQASTASARPVQIWSLQELTEKADIVIVGTASSSADAKDHAYPNAKPDTWVAVDTVFTIDTALKGELKGKTLTVRHNRYHDQSAEVTVVDGPCFVEFNSKLKNRYLIFLRRNEEGLFEPLTGQYDPVDSFFRLDDYHVTQERKTKAD